MTAGRFPLTWDLESLLPAPVTPAFRTALDAFTGKLKALAESAEKMPAFQVASIAAWETFLEQYETLDAQYTDFSAFMGCQSAGDAENKLYQQLEAELSALNPDRERLATTVEFALKDLSDADFQQTVKASAYLTKIEYFLRLKRRQAKFRLPRDQELLAADLAVDGLHAWGRMYDRLCGALRVSIVEKGKPVQKSPGQVLFDSPQRTVRENNFFAVDAAWATIEDSCADAINHIAGTRLTTYRRLGLKDHLEAPLLYNRMSRATLDAMWNTITAHKPILKDYLDCKARWLGLEKLSWYDLAAPLPSIPGTVVDDDIPYDQACDWIIEAFQQFSPELGDFAKMSLTQKWVEAENRSGKRQGGFCTGLPTKKVSRIFMTYTVSADSMSTLAHELGHAYHSWVLRDEPVFLADYPMNLAETASTFAEAVLNEQRLQRAKTDYEKLSLLDGLLGDAVAFLMNIHARFIFENAFHLERPRSELTAKRLGELMEAAQQEAYLGALADGGWNPRFWASKLHFYITGLPFYNFPYTFGYLLSLGVYAVGRDSGPTFPEQYRKLLMATGCQDAEDAVQSTLGFDLRGPDFWKKSLSIITDRVQQFRTLTDNVLGKTRQL